MGRKRKSQPSVPCPRADRRIKQKKKEEKQQQKPKPHSSSKKAAGLKVTSEPRGGGGGGTACECAYSGWMPRRRRKEEVAVEDLSPAVASSLFLEDRAAATWFWSHYVSARRPVVLRNAHRLLGPNWRVTSPSSSSSSSSSSLGWTLERLRERASSCQVKVERRESVRGRFGEGREVRMTFGRFLAGLEAGDDLHYMTTQDIARDADGRPAVLAPPLTLLADDFPLRPTLMGGLVPANINLWMGNSREGAMSGLHHDFHDNLYILLRGCKRFTLFPPSDAGRMYTQGRILSVHPNGLIAYQPGVRSDGADVAAEAALEADRAHARAEAELAAAEVAVESGEPGAQERLREAETALEAALDRVLSAQMAGGDDNDDEGNDDDDFDNFDDFEDDEGGENKENKKAQKGGEEAEEEETEMVRIKDTDGGAALPQNFSKVDMGLPAEEREARWPLLQEASMVECEVRAGDMLFLPAGWFHNVTSFSDGDAGFHMALNYW